MTTSAEALELDPATPPPDDPPAQEPQDHIAQCAVCPVTAKFRRTANGGGFIIVDSFGVDAETSFGVGPNIIPECPHGHGEMQLADEQLPAADAFALAQEQLHEQRPPRLPFPTPPFNYEAAIHSIFETRREVARLEVRLSEADEKRKKAKTALDDANEYLGELIDKFQDAEKDRIAELERKQCDAENGHPESTNLVRCKWEEQHPGETCPICSDGSVSGTHPGDSVLHIDDVVGLLDMRAVVAVGDALALRQTVVPLQTIKCWSLEDRAAVKAWAEFDPSSADPTPERPTILGTSHVASEGRNNEAQVCTQCDAVLIAAPAEGEEPNYYTAGWLIGSGCRGTSGHHYPKRGRKRQQAAE